MAEPTPAQVEAAARALYRGAAGGLPQFAWEERTADEKRHWLNQARAALTAAAQVHQTDEDRHGPWLKDAQRYTDGCDEDRPHAAQVPGATHPDHWRRHGHEGQPCPPYGCYGGATAQPAPEADEREALVVAWRSWDLNDAEACADAILAAGFRRSQPAPRTVSAAEVHAAWHVIYPRQDGPPPGYVWPLLAALGITVEAPRD